MSKEMLSQLNKLAWKRRLVAALKDGLEVEGPGAVHAAIQEAVKGLGINAPLGTPRQEIPEEVLEGCQVLGRLRLRSDNEPARASCRHEQAGVLAMAD